MNVEENVQEMAIARGIGADMRAGVWAGLYAVISMGLIITSAVFLYSTLDDRISLTTIEVFHDWRGLRQVFQDTSAYDPRVNLPALEYYTHFDGGSVSMDAMRDLHERGLLTDVQLGNFTSMFNLTSGLPLVGMADPHLLQQLASVFFSRFVGTAFPNSTKDLPREVVAGGINFVDPMILSRLYRVSGCSFPDALPGSTPATRSQGCACIAKTYVDFVLATAKMYTNVTRAARDEASDAVLRCMDRRVTWRTWGAGEVWTVHPLALALYSNGVFFLVCFAYLISFYHDSLFPAGWDGVMRTRVIQAMLVLVTGVLIFLLLLHNPFGNALQAVGLLLSLSTFLFSARRVLDYPNSNGGSRVPFVPEPHPLMVCFWLNLPLLIPGPLVGLALAGYTRDVYAVWIVAIVGSMMGILLSRFFWYVWNDDHEFIHLILPPLGLVFVDLLVMLVIQLAMYSSDLKVYTMSDFGFLIMFFVIGMFIVLILWFEFHRFLQSVKHEKDSVQDLNQRFEDGEHAPLLALTAILLLIFTVIACIDAKRG